MKGLSSLSKADHTECSSSSPDPSLQRGSRRGRFFLIFRQKRQCFCERPLRNGRLSWTAQNEARHLAARCTLQPASGDRPCDLPLRWRNQRAQYIVTATTGQARKCSLGIDDLYMYGQKSMRAYLVSGIDI